MTRRRETLSTHSYLANALAGIIHDWRIGCWWDDNPQATNCLLCGLPNLNHPDNELWETMMQYQTMLRYTLDTPLDEESLDLGWTRW